MIEVSASAKVILFGEHAVVYGEPAIAVPLSSLRANAQIVESDAELTIVARDLNFKRIHFTGEDPLAKAVRLTLKVLNAEAPHGEIVIQSSIPIASGLGSGAAISTVMVKALVAWLKRDLSLEAINEIVYEVEKIHHGTPSGIDNTVIVYEKPIYFVREKPIEQIVNREPLHLLIADTGHPSPTKHSVGGVRKLYQAQPETIGKVIEAIGVLVCQARRAMADGDLTALGQYMYDNHALLQTLTVSSPALDQLVAVAREMGALGAKLSGGGRGGNMIAMVADGQQGVVKEALLGAGAVQVYETIVEPS